MNIDQLIGSLKSLLEQAHGDLQKAQSSQDVEKVRISYLGKKGRISEILSGLRELDLEARKAIGQVGTSVRTDLETALDLRKSEFEAEELELQLKNQSLDISLPGIEIYRGAKHPVRETMNDCISILREIGLADVYGPEIEYESYCFDRLNFKPGHAARDMQATFFVKGSSDPLVLRTHTSSVQVRVLLEAAANQFSLPIRIQAPGRVYRMDDDRTHSPMFHQIEGLVVDRHSTMGDLRAHLDYFFKRYFGDSVKVRFRPSYFPFTEPSAEVDISCVFCSGQGCRVCKESGWIEVAGAGLVHPEVFTACGWESSKVQGWAFGVGIERLCMLKNNIPDLRLFFENRLSFLRGGVL